MKTPSPVLEALARRYERSQAGRTGAANRDLLVLFEDLLAEAGCNEGENRALCVPLLSIRRCGIASVASHVYRDWKT